MASTNTKTKNLVRSKIDLAATGAQDSTAIDLKTTPARPGGGIIVRLEALDGTAKFKLQQAGVDPATVAPGSQPATGSSYWTDVATFDTTDATTALTQEFTLANDTRFLRWNVTVLHAASFAIANITFPGG